MATIEQVQALAARGFYVFPVEPGGKLPAVKDWPKKATRDAEQIAKWWSHREYNVGISTTKFGDDKALVVVDVDTKEGKDGNGSLIQLELEGNDLPTTLEHATPSGGRHLIYVADAPCRQGVDVLGNGLDIRSRGGFIVGPGSSVAGKPYHQINGHGTLAEAPSWLVARLGEDRVLDRGPTPVLGGVDGDRARSRAIDFLRTAPVAVEGQGGDITTYKVAAKLKDLGCTEQETLFYMTREWNDRCSPPWSFEELEYKVDHAYRYGREPQGIAAPEAVFPKAETPADEEDEGTHPVDALNEQFAFIKRGAFVLQETTDEKGRFMTEHLDIGAFHAWFANKSMQVGDKRVALSKLWMTRTTRREYDSVVFAPGGNVDGRFYNLWRGFAVAPADTSHHPSVEQFIEHAHENVCNGNDALTKWLLGWFAHLIQRPGEKPLVACVFQGLKGTGKNALVERVGALLGSHFRLADDERYLLGNFNSHLESNLLFVLDEASWAGDKRAEGKLKGIITGTSHNIERKGKEPYTVDNLTRVAIIGNEDWLVPATIDERRFAVFQLGTKRKQDRKFFESMRKGMEAGGYSHLLRYFMDYDLTGVDVNDAPSTAGLVAQKHASLEPAMEWWLDCLMSGQLIGSAIGELPHKIPTNRVVEAFQGWARGRNIRQRLPGRNKLFEQLQGAAPSLGKPKKAQPDNMGDATYAFINPGIGALRQDWERYVDGAVAWSD